METGDLETEVTSMFPSCSRLNPFRLLCGAGSGGGVCAAHGSAASTNGNSLRDRTTRLRHLGSGRPVILTRNYSGVRSGNTGTVLLLQPVRIDSPGLDGLLDRIGRQAFSGRPLRQRDEFSVGSKTQRDALRHRNT